MTLEKQQMIDRVYEVIADKTLSFGCNIKIPEPNWKWYSIWKYIWWETDKRHCEYSTFATVSWSQMSEEIMLNKEHIIIWHPVMIWDVLDWCFEKYDLDLYKYCDNWTLLGNISMLWKEKRKPIEDQSEECISFIYNLIEDEQKTK